MAEPLAGIRVLEVATHVFVPIGGAMLTEWGAEVLKIEHPVSGDPYRGLVTAGLIKDADGIDPNFQFTNRGKQSITLDLKTPQGRDLLYRLAARCDVFLTNMRPGALRRLKIECADLRAHNPDIIYVRGSGYGARGPDADRAGYDGAAFWARAGFATALTPASSEYPIHPRPAFGDVMGGMAVAGAIAAALYRRQATGTPSEVDVSLLGVGMWQLQPDVVAAGINPAGLRHAPPRAQTANPISATYRTRDGRFIMLVMLEADRHWPNFCQVIGRPDLIADPRFADMAARKANAAACVAILDEVFAGRDFAEWCEVLKDATGVWSPIQTPAELHDDPQVRANGALADVEMANGSTLAVVTSPAQFDGQPPRPTRAPEHGEHTETALLELGIPWEEISALKEANVLG